MSERREFRDLASAAELHRTIADLEFDAGTERVPLREARGRVLARRIDATIDVPGFDRAAMDGYAVRAGDTAGAGEADPVELDLAGAVHAGEEPSATVDPGTAVEVSTGAVLPPGADAVVMVEETSERDGAVAVRSAVTPGQHVMAAGADVAAGDRALGPGTRLTPREIGLLSALGVDRVPVRAAPTVGIVSTGDELVRPGDPLDHEAGQIHDVNSYAIASAVAEAGGEPTLYPHVGDDQDAMEEVLIRAAEECDLVLSSGSTSASAMDVVYRVIEDRGELLLHGVAVKPGKPTIVGRLGGAAYVGLPGYPVSALSIYRTFVAPAIREAAGLPEARTATVDAEMAVRERYEEGRRRLTPVALVADGDGTWLAYPVDKGSGATTTLVDADGVVDVDPNTAYLEEGERVTVELFSVDARPPTLLGVGEGDPRLWDLLDELERPRYLARGARAGARSLRDGVADVAVLAGPVTTSIDAVELGGWDREWGLVVPAGNPEGIDGVADLADRDLAVAALTDQWGLQASFEAALEDLADERGAAAGELIEAVGAIPTRAHESPARRVDEGDADAGLGLRSTAERLDLAFVPLGRDRVRVVAAPDRAGKPAVERLRDLL